MRNPLSFGRTYGNLLKERNRLIHITIGVVDRKHDPLNTNFEQQIQERGNVV
jgi:hypothetical protein